MSSQSFGRSPPDKSRYGIVVLFGVAAIGIGAMLVQEWALFLDSSWNDVRLASARGLVQGVAIYPGTSGPPHTWMYGPLPMWWLLPTANAGSPQSAMAWAGVVTALTSIGAIALVCAYTPLSLPSRSWDLRWAAAMLTLALWPKHLLQFIQADNLAIALGLLSNLMLMRSRKSLSGWSAACLAGAGLLCKQTSVAVPVAQLVWLILTRDPKAALTHAKRLMVAVIGWWTLAGLIESPEAILFNLIVIPGNLPWAENPMARLWDVAPQLVPQILLPAMVALLLRWGSRDRSDPITLPFLTWALASVPGLAALFTYGGNINSMQGFALWLPVAILCVLQRLAEGMSVRKASSLALAVGALLCGFTVASTTAPTPRESLARYDDALAYAISRPGEVWFPWAPLVSLYAEQRRYADEDGLAVRALAGKAIPMALLKPNLPPHLRAIAVRRSTPLWGVIDEVRPPGFDTLLLGEWVIYDWSMNAVE